MSPHSTIFEGMSAEKREVLKELGLFFDEESYPSEGDDDSETEVESTDSEDTYEDLEVFCEDTIPDGNEIHIEGDGFSDEPSKPSEEPNNKKFLKKLQKGAKEFNQGKVNLKNDGVFLTKTTNKAFKFNIQFLSLKSEYFKYFIQKRSSMKQKFYGRLEELDGLPVFHIDENPFVLDKILKFIYEDNQCYKFDDYKLATRVMYAAEFYGLDDYKSTPCDFYNPIYSPGFGLSEYAFEVQRLLVNFKGIFALNKCMVPENKLHIKIQGIKDSQALTWTDFARTESELKAVINAALPYENPLEVLRYACQYYKRSENHMLHWGTYPLEDIAHSISWEKIEDLDKIKGLKMAIYPLIKEETWAKIKSFHNRVKDIRKNKRDCDCKKCNIFMNCKYNKMPENDKDVRVMLEAGVDTHPDDALLFAFDYYSADKVSRWENIRIDEMLENFFPREIGSHECIFKEETWEKIHAKNDKIYTEIFDFKELENC